MPTKRSNSSRLPIDSPRNQAHLWTNREATMKVIARSVAALVFASAVGFLCGTAVISAAEDLEAAGPNDPSIALSDFRMEFPYRDPVDSTAEPDETAVGLSFDQDWTVESYPGEVVCRIEIVGAKGDVLGSDIVSVGS